MSEAVERNIEASAEGVTLSRDLAETTHALTGLIESFEALPDDGQTRRPDAAGDATDAAMRAA
jgi:hypothetical protein